MIAVSNDRAGLEAASVVSLRNALRRFRGFLKQQCAIGARLIVKMSKPVGESEQPLMRRQDRYSSVAHYRGTK